jgi:hypothetical protein
MDYYSCEEEYNEAMANEAAAQAEANQAEFEKCQPEQEYIGQFPSKNRGALGSNLCL